MSTDTVLTVADQVVGNIQAQQPEELQLIATSREQMAIAQKGLIDWAQRKLDDANQQAQEASEAKTVALAGGFNTAPFTRNYQRSVRLAEFYTKIKGALEAGYVIVPDFPVDVFAIRTRRQSPDAMRSTSSWEDRSQSGQCLPTGEGEYRDSDPVVYQRTYPEKQADGTTKGVVYYHAKDFRDVIDFPLSMAKPEIMDEVSTAMQHKIFDEIGVLPNRKIKKKDPIVVGIIKDPRSSTYNVRRVMFLLAWYIDTRTI